MAMISAPLLASCALFALLAAASLCTAQSNTGGQQQSTDTCVVDNLVLNKGDSVRYAGTEPNCRITTCRGNNTVATLGCSLLSFGPGETVVSGNPNSPYPGCCNSVVPANQQYTDTCVVDEWLLNTGDSVAYKGYGNNCRKVTCHGNNTVSTDQCPLLSVRLGYTVVPGDYDSSYPACCSSIARNQGV